MTTAKAAPILLTSHLLGIDALSVGEITEAMEKVFGRHREINEVFRQKNEELADLNRALAATYAAVLDLQKHPDLGMDYLERGATRIALHPAPQ